MKKEFRNKKVKQREELAVMAVEKIKEILKKKNSFTKKMIEIEDVVYYYGEVYIK
jgi:hypothetical protein